MASTRQTYERDIPDGSSERPILVVGRIDDVFHDDDDNQYLRGFSLVDAGTALGKGLSILDFRKNPYEPVHHAPIFEMLEYRRGRYVRCEFTVYDTYEEAMNGGQSADAGCAS